MSIARSAENRFPLFLIVLWAEPYKSRCGGSMMKELVAALLLAVGGGLLAAAPAFAQQGAPAKPAARVAAPAAPGAQVDRPADGTAAAPQAPHADAAARDSGVLGTPGDPPDNRHAGYYYPPVTSNETYVA